MIYIGVDPGLTGAIAVLGTTFAEVYDMPVVPVFETGRVKNAVDLERLCGVLEPYVNCGIALSATIEKVSSRGGQDVTTMFSLGMSFWGAAGVLHALHVPVHMVEPRAWKGRYRLTKDKELSLTLARKMFPAVDLRLAKHHNRAEALLLAQYGRDTRERFRY